MVLARYPLEYVPQTLRGNLAYQQRQQRRQDYINKKRITRQTFQMGRILQAISFEGEDLAVIYGLLLEAKAQLQSFEADTIRQRWHLQGRAFIPEKM